MMSVIKRAAVSGYGGYMATKLCRTSRKKCRRNVNKNKIKVNKELAYWDCAAMAKLIVIAVVLRWWSKGRR